MVHKYSKILACIYLRTCMIIPAQNQSPLTTHSYNKKDDHPKNRVETFLENVMIMMRMRKLGRKCEAHIGKWRKEEGKRKY